MTTIPYPIPHVHHSEIGDAPHWDTPGVPDSDGTLYLYSEEDITEMLMDAYMTIMTQTTEQQAKLCVDIIYAELTRHNDTVA